MNLIYVSAGNDRLLQSWVIDVFRNRDGCFLGQAT
jgi:hypothetical protein